MMRTSARFLAVLFSVVLITSGFSATVLAQPLGEQEPNDVKQTATPLTVAHSVSGEISSATDRDWYAFEAVEGTTPTITLNNRGTVDYDLFDADNRSLVGAPTEFSFESGSGANVGVFTAPQTGTYYLLLASNRGSTPTYTIEIEGTHPPNEPNDDHESSVPLDDGEAVEGEITSTNDEDWYSFEAVEGANVSLTLVVDGHISYNVLDQNHRLLDAESTGFSFESEDDRTYVGRFVAPETGVYYFVVLPGHVTNSSYTVEVAGNLPPNEPNDDFVNSTRLSLGTPLEGEISSNTDVDYYSFEAESGDTVSVTLENESPITYGIRGPNDAQVDLLLDGDVGQFVAPETGTYHFWVESVDGGLSEYSLSVDSDSAEVPREVLSRLLSNLSDTQIIAAVIGAVATIVAALLTAVVSRRS